jgi:hypothetical protein
MKYSDLMRYNYLMKYSVSARPFKETEGRSSEPSNELAAAGGGESYPMNDSEYSYSMNDMEHGYPMKHGEDSYPMKESEYRQQGSPPASAAGGELSNKIIKPRSTSRSTARRVVRSNSRFDGSGRAGGQDQGSSRYSMKRIKMGWWWWWGGSSRVFRSICQFDGIRWVKYYGY